MQSADSCRNDGILNDMMIMLHVLIACASIVCSVLGLATASRRVVMASHVLVGATVASGSALMLLESVSLLHLCVSGLIYTMLAGVLGFAAHRRLAIQTNR